MENPVNTIATSRLNPERVTEDRPAPQPGRGLVLALHEIDDIVNFYENQVKSYFYNDISAVRSPWGIWRVFDFCLQS